MGAPQARQPAPQPASWRGMPCPRVPDPPWSDAGVRKSEGDSAHGLPHYGLVDQARRLDFRIIEDDAYGILTEDDPPVPPLAVLAPEQTWHLRSTSKGFTPGLRAAWMIVPLGREEQAANLIRATVWTAPPLGAAIASLWVGDGTAAVLEAEKRHEARVRQAIAARLLPIRGSLSAHPASMHLWLDLPRRTAAQDLVQRLEFLGVRITPGAAFGIGSAPNSVRLALGAPMDRHDLERALRAVAGAL